MKAIVTKAFVGRPDDEIVARNIATGEVLTGDLADVALREKWAEPVEKADRRAAAAAAKAAAEKQQIIEAAQAKLADAEATLAAADEAGKATAQVAVDEAKQKLADAEAALAALS